MAHGSACSASSTAPACMSDESFGLLLFLAEVKGELVCVDHIAREEARESGEEGARLFFTINSHRN